MNTNIKETMKKWRKEGSPRLYKKSDILNAIKTFCIDCYGSNHSKHCRAFAPECRFQFIRHGIHRQPTKDKNGKMVPIYKTHNILNTIKEECIECLGTSDVKTCTSPNCGLYKFRFGNSSKQHWGE